MLRAVATQPQDSGLLAYILRPYNLIGLTVALSLLAWLFPDVPGIRRGFSDREPFTIQACVILGLWYSFVFSLSVVGFHFGRLIAPPAKGRVAARAPLSSSLPYVVFTAIALIGVLYTYGVIASRGALSAYFANAKGASANMLKEALYQDYAIGPLSLRYVGIISGSLAFYRIMKSGRVRLLEMVNIAIVLAISFLSGRMLLLWTICGVAGGYTLLRDHRLKRRASKFLCLLAVAVLVLLWGLNYSRNHLFYDASGSTGFISSGLGEALTYLDTPIQVSLGVANHWHASVSGVAPWLLVEYDAENLTTNSALSQLLPEFGYLTFLLIGAQCLIFSAVAGWCSRQKDSYFYFGFPIIGYAFAELWRLDLFSYGIFYCLLTVFILVPTFFGEGSLKRRPLFAMARRPAFTRSESLTIKRS